LNSLATFLRLQGQRLVVQHVTAEPVPTSSQG
jgi:hypothetical protein